MMINLITLITFLTLLSPSQEKSECEEPTLPYWAYGINSRVEGEVPTLEKAFRNIQQTETEIEPANGFITLRLDISKTGKFCDIETFEIDEDYESTVFNNGELREDLEKIAIGLKNWKRDKEYKTYNLIRIKIKNGKIEEIF